MENIKLEELESLLLIISRGLETSKESFTAKDVANMLAVILDGIKQINM